MTRALVFLSILLTSASMEAQLSFESRTEPLGTCPAHVRAVDMNGDGDIDLVVANHHTHDVWVLLGDGTGAFPDVSAFPVPGFDVAHDLSLGVADFDTDGHLDVAVVSFSNDEATVFFGDGTGQLASPAQFPVGDYPLRLEVADVNADGFPDIAVVNRDDDSVSILIGDGAGSFAPEVSYSVGDAPTALAVVDTDGDGHLDVVTADAFSMTLTFLLGIGDGTFATGAVIATPDIPTAVEFASVVGTSPLDLLVTYGNVVAVLTGDGSGNYSDSVEYSVGTFPRFVIAADMNSDGLEDLVTANSQSSDLTILLADGSGFSGELVLPLGQSPWSVVAADLDGDGLLDLAATNEGDNTLTVLLRHAEATFRRADCNGDGSVDLGDGIGLLSYLFQSDDEPGCLLACDVNDDGVPDLGDVIALLDFLFSGSEAPPSPFGSCGPDPTPDGLGCRLIASTCP